MTLIKDVLLRGADGKLLDYIDREQARELLDTRKARIVSTNPDEFIVQMRLQKTVVVLSPSGIELRKTDMFKARKLIQQRKVRVVNKKPLIIQFIKPRKLDAGIESCIRSDAF